MQTVHQENLISPNAADRLIAAHDGDVALLCIYYNRIGCVNSERAAAELCRTMNEIKAAEEKLFRMGLLGEISSADVAHKPVEQTRSALVRPEIPVKYDRMQHTAAEIAERADTDSDFRAVLAETEQVMGHKLSSGDTRILFNVFDTLALPLEVFMLLLHYCAEKNTEKYGGQRKLTAYFIEKEAFDWAENEILTIEQAEDYIQNVSKRRTDGARLAAVIGMGGKPLTKSVQEYINHWLDLGFDESTVAIAYDRTMLQTGKLSFRYLNTILERWKNNGLMTVREINEKDPPRSLKSAPVKPEAQSTAAKIDELKNLLDKI